MLRVLDLIGRENVHLSDSRMGEILTMVQKEALLEEVEKAEAQLESAAKVASEIQDGKQVGFSPSLSLPPSPSLSPSSSIVLPNHSLSQFS